MATPEPTFASDDLLLIALELDQLILTESLAVYGDPADPFLPLGELTRLLDLDVSVAPGRVTGRLGQPPRLLDVDARTGRGRTGARELAISPADFREADGEVYLRSSRVSDLLPVGVLVDTEALSLKLVAKETLPVQARLERAARAGGSRADGSDDGPVMRLEAPYRLLSPPVFDVALELSGSSSGGGVQGRYDIRSAGDFLGAGYQAYVGSNDQGEASDARLVFEKNDAGGRLLGPLRATSWSAGDVFTPGLAIGPHSQGGRGFTFSTGALEPASVFDRIDLRGELPIGNDAELYVNDVLRSGQRSPVQGRYEFLDVPLVRGSNVIKIVTYGPRGERSEQSQVINVGGGQLAPGETTFNFGVVDQQKSLFRLSSSGLAENGENLPQAGGARAVANLAFGVSNRLTVTAGGALYSVRRGVGRVLASLGIRTSVGGFAVQADGAHDHKGGTGVSLGLAGQPWGVSTVVRHSEFRSGFVDEVLAGGDTQRALRRHTEFSVDSSSLQLRGRVVPLSVRGQIQAFNDESSSALASVRTSGSLAGVVISGGVDHQVDSGVTYTNRRTTGVVGASRFSAEGWQYRATVDYQLGREAQLSSAAFTADRQLREALALRLGVGRGFGEGGDTTLLAGTVWRTSLGDLSLNTDYSTEKRDLKVGLRFAFGLIPGLRRSRYAVTRPGPATSGSAVLQAFVDSDGDGQLSPGEQAVSKAVVAGGEKNVSTDAQGRAFVTGLGGVSSRLQIGLEALEDPFLKSPPSRVEFPGRPGLMMRVAYPLTPTSEAVARLVVTRDGKMVGLSAVRVRLVGQGRPTIEGVTEFDGTVHFDSLPAGSYKLELDADQAKRLGMSLKRDVDIVVSTAGGELADLVAEVTFGPSASPAIYAERRQ